MDISIKRVYEPAVPQDGTRILVDRLWPRGLRKQEARIDEWLKDIAPSTGLRKWFNHDPAKWTEFRKRYARELEGKGHDIDIIRQKADRGKVTLVYGAKDERHNDAVVLQDYVQQLLTHAR